MKLLDEQSCSDQNYLSGDPVAFAALVKLYQSGLFGFLGRMGLEPAICEELAQETFLRAWINRDRYDTDKASVSTWLFTIARNLALNHLAKETRVVSNEGDVSQPTDPRADPSDRFEQHQSIVRLRQALSTLSTDDREVIATCYTPEIKNTSGVLGCSAAALRTRLSRARQRLSDALDQLDS